MTDTFGETTVVPAGRRTPTWQMFRLSAPGAPQPMQSLLFLPPTLIETQESDPVEEVAFFRDEMANVVWGVERTVQGTAGAGIDRYEEAQRALAARGDQRIATDTGDAELLYRLSTHVPDHWYPFVPVQARRCSARRCDPARAAAAGAGSPPTARASEIQPRGRILTAAEPLRLEEEEVPRDGAVVDAQPPARALDRRALPAVVRPEQADRHRRGRKRPSLRHRAAGQRPRRLSIRHR